MLRWMNMKSSQARKKNRFFFSSSLTDTKWSIRLRTNLETYIRRWQWPTHINCSHSLVLFISNKGSSISLHLSIIVILRIDSTLIFFFFSEWSSLQYCVMEIFFSSSTNNKHCTYRWNNKREILLGDISFDWTLLDCCCLIIKKKEKKISQKWVQRIRRH